MNEKANTFRRLTDEPLLIKSVWCHFGWHNWTQYSPPKTRIEGVYHIDYQVRHCDNCNLHDFIVLRKV
jgi:hypothetical protein